MVEEPSGRVTVIRDGAGWRADIPDLRTVRRARSLHALDRRVREVLGHGRVEYQFHTGDEEVDRLVAGVRASRRAARAADDQARQLTERVLVVAAGLSQRDLAVQIGRASCRGR